jgi:hypothetical protein
MVGVILLSLSFSACGPTHSREVKREGIPSEIGAPESMVKVSGHGEEPTLMGGDSAMIVTEDGSPVYGFLVSVRKRDGSLVPAVFRGPTRLADLASGGTYEFHEDSLTSRVRLLRPGEELRPWRGGRW